MFELLAACLAVLLAAVIILLIWLQRARQQCKSLQTMVANLSAKEAILLTQAYHDSLTGLGNRRLLVERFTFALERSKRSGKPFALLMLDLDDFKAVNDAYGHVAGDSVLMISAKRLVAAVRGSDTVSRLGGDEFVVLMESFEGRRDLVHIGRKLIAKLSEEINLENGILINVGASVGFALYPDHGTDLNDLLHIADKSMYDCKTSGLMGLS
jgi:diguanylate cyclase (GGDEF)-like protein